MLMKTCIVYGLLLSAGVLSLQRLGLSTAVGGLGMYIIAYLLLKFYDSVGAIHKSARNVILSKCPKYLFCRTLLTYGDSSFFICTISPTLTPPPGPAVSLRQRDG